MSETWRPIPGYEGHYEVSDQGRLVSVKFGRRLLKPDVTGYGYPRVSLVMGGQRTRMYVHRAVLNAFVGPRPEGLETRHLDGDPANNHLSNICYGTHAENVQDMFRHGRHSSQLTRAG